MLLSKAFSLAARTNMTLDELLDARPSAASAPPLEGEMGCETVVRACMHEYTHTVASAQTCCWSFNSCVLQHSRTHTHTHTHTHSLTYSLTHTHTRARAPDTCRRSSSHQKRRVDQWWARGSLLMRSLLKSAKCLGKAERNLTQCGRLDATLKSVFNQACCPRRTPAHIHVHTSMYTHTHTLTHSLTHSLTHTLTHARTHAHTHTHTHTHTHAHTHTHTTHAVEACGSSSRQGWSVTS
jgi:hypothetical protein